MFQKGKEREPPPSDTALMLHISIDRVSIGLISRRLISVVFLKAISFTLAM